MEIELQDMDGNVIDVFEVSDSVFQALEKIAGADGISVEDLILQAILEKAEEVIENEPNEA